MSVMLITSCLMVLVMLMVWRTPTWVALLFFACFGSIEAVYLSATLYKVANGAWFPVLLSGFLLLIMYAWHFGSSRKSIFDQKHAVNVRGLTVRRTKAAAAPRVFLPLRLLPIVSQKISLILLRGLGLQIWRKAPPPTA
jgi:K+ transporter